MNEQQRGHAREQQGSGTNWKLWGAGIAALLLLVFVLENSQEVRIKFLFVETTTPLIFGLLIAGLLGFLVGWLFPIVRGRNKAEKR